MPWATLHGPECNFGAVLFLQESGADLDYHPLYIQQRFLRLHSPVYVYAFVSMALITCPCFLQGQIYEPAFVPPRGRDTGPELGWPGHDPGCAHYPGSVYAGHELVGSEPKLRAWSRATELFIHALSCSNSASCHTLLWAGVNK